MDDPVAHFQTEVDTLNKARKKEGVRKISDTSPVLYLGHFLLRSIMDKLKIQRYVDLFNLAHEFEYNLFGLMSSLVYARSVFPCSKNRTFHEVLPNLYSPNDTYDYSYDQLLDGVSFLGQNYEKFIELFTVQVKSSYGLDTSKTYFDCTNFYFEIDREDDFRRKGPSKENRKSPIVGMGLLLDSNQIPVSMKMYPGNESEKPVIRDVISQLKKQNNITGRTIHVADKGLNRAQNIAFSKINGDGYLFSKTVKGLSKQEKAWVLLDSDWHEVKDSQGKVVYSYKSCIDKFPYNVEHEGKEITVKLTEKRLLAYNPLLASKKRYEINRMVEKAAVSINQKAIDKDLLFAGYNLFVTSEIEMTDQDIYSIYQNLWRIEESFKIMKSDLDARPVYLQKEDSIKGHFLICYLAVLLERILQFKILGNKYSTSDIFGFIRNFKATKGENKYINIAANSKFINELADNYDLPLTNYFLTETQIKSIFNYKL